MPSHGWDRILSNQNSYASGTRSSVAVTLWCSTSPTGGKRLCS